MPDSTNKRYPGARPFKNSQLDRKLFFGREDEKKRLLHLILSNNIVVLFAKSGVGKSSLLNAGVFKQLYDRKYFPISIRLNDPSVEIIDNIETHIVKDALINNIEYIPREKDSVWNFLKTAEFWNEDDKLLTPVLVFDQFEEIFTLGYSEEQRKNFFLQLASLSKEKRKSVQGSEGKSTRYYIDSPPKVKIVLSLREEFLAQLEEISEDIPSILHNRFRLTALSSEQAIDAIKNPASLEDENLTTQKFAYSPDAISSVTNFLIKKDLRERLKIISRDSKWPISHLLIFGFLLIIPILLGNIFYGDNTILSSAASSLISSGILWLIIPAFIFTLAIRNPIAARNSIVPIVLLYAWFSVLCSVMHTGHYFLDSLFLSILPPAIVSLFYVWGISTLYRNGRNKMLSITDISSAVEEFNSKKWPRKPIMILLGWIFISAILFGFTNNSSYIFILNIIIILIFFIVLFYRTPISFNKLLLPIASAFGLNNLILVLSLFGYSLGEPMLAFFTTNLIAAIFFLLLLGLLSWSYLRGMESVDEQILKVLGSAKEKIEPFQLQLLCQNIEDKVLLKQNKHEGKDLITITEKDFGGETGMRRILKKFYDDQLLKIDRKSRRKVRKLCEKGLISQSGRRRSLAEDDIENRFKLNKDILSELIDVRLLRAEPRLGIKYYEISHDTLLQPILTSSKVRVQRDLAKKWLIFAASIIFVAYAFNFYNSLKSPSSESLYLQMENVLESKSVLLTDKIQILSTILHKLDQRKMWETLVPNKDINKYNNKGSSDFNDYEAYESWLNEFKEAERTSLKIKNVKLLNDAGGVLNPNNVQPGDVSLEFSSDSSTYLQYNLEIENYYGKYSRYNAMKLINTISIETNSDAVNSETQLNLSELLSDGYNQLRFYELDNDDPAIRYLIDVFDYRIRMKEMSFYKNKTLDKSKDSKDLAYLGYLYSSNQYRGSDGEYENAFEYLDEAIELDPDYAHPYYWRAEVYKKQRNFEKAIPNYLKAYSIDNTIWQAKEELLKGKENKISNGSFELPKILDNDHLLTSELSINSKDQDVGSFWENKAGLNFELKTSTFGHGDAWDRDQFIELAGKSNSSIQQEVYTERYTEYVLSFAFSPHPGTGFEDNEMEILWDHAVIGTIKADGSQYVDTHWETYFYSVTALSDTSYLEFRDIGESKGDTEGSGPLLDAVFLVKGKEY